MNTLTISLEEIATKAEDKKHYVLLGDTDITKSELLKEAIEGKIGTKNKNEFVPGFWGTLGMPDDSPIDFSGNLQMSKYGNETSTGEVAKDIQALKDFKLITNTDNARVIERFINFDNITFNEPAEIIYSKNDKEEMENNIPKLRLTVFLQSDEGALVCYEHCKDPSDNDEDKFLEYIFPEDEPLGNRDRLNYIFPIVPLKLIEDDGNGNPAWGIEHHHSFIIKVLIFKRETQATPSIQLQSIFNTIDTNAYPSSAIGEINKYGLILFDSKANDWIDGRESELNIDCKVKTLFLFHGTFVNTRHSFKGLLETNYLGNEKSWLQQMIENGKYKQVIGFDHPSVMEDAEQNANVLLAIFNKYNINFTGNPVDVITTSRGGLVAKYLIYLTDKFPVNKVAHIACANGVGYFTPYGKGQINLILSLLKTVLSGLPAVGEILGLFQFGVNASFNLPGFLQMTPGHQKLTTILSSKPSAINTNAVFQTIVGDWDKKLVDGKLKRILATGADWEIRKILGEENDWVVGTNEQKLLPDGYYTNQPREVNTFHTNYLLYEQTIGDAKLYLTIFL